MGWGDVGGNTHGGRTHAGLGMHECLHQGSFTTAPQSMLQYMRTQTTGLHMPDAGHVCAHDPRVASARTLECEYGQGCPRAQPPIGP
eukprot:15062296-Alexandrium_andersonii.AAC.1